MLRVQSSFRHVKESDISSGQVRYIKTLCYCTILYHIVFYWMFIYVNLVTMYVIHSRFYMLFLWHWQQLETISNSVTQKGPCVG